MKAGRNISRPLSATKPNKRLVASKFEFMNHVDYVYDIVVDEAWDLKWSNGRNKWLCWIKFVLDNNYDVEWLKSWLRSSIEIELLELVLDVEWRDGFEVRLNWWRARQENDVEWQCQVTMSTARAAHVKESNGQSSSRTGAQHRGTRSKSSESLSQQLISGLTKYSSFWIVRSKQWIKFYKWLQNYLGKQMQ